MASGAIIGLCPVCNDHIWEDQWVVYDDIIMHEDCIGQYVENKYRITNGQYKKLSKEQQILKEIKELKTSMESSFKYYSDRIKELEEKLKEG